MVRQQSQFTVRETGAQQDGTAREFQRPLTSGFMLESWAG